MKRIHSTVFLLLMTAHAQTGMAQTDACDLKSLTNSCADFQADGKPLIELQDGTIIPNFAAITKELSDPRAHMDLAKRGGLEIQQQFMDQTIKINQILDQVSDQKLSPTAKLSFIQSAQGLKELLASTHNDNGMVPVPWPLSSKGPLQLTKVSAVKESLKEIMGDNLYTSLVSEADKFPSQSDVSMKQEPESLRRLATFTPARAAHVNELVSSVKAMMISVIQGNRTEGQLSPAEKEAIKKISLITTQDFNRVGQTSEDCEPLPQAFYNPEDHSINICPKFVNLPDATIVSVLAHEMGHSIDVCNSQFPTFKINWSKVDALHDDKGDFKDPDLINIDGMDSALEGLSGNEYIGKTDYTSFPFELASSPEAEKYLIKNGLIQEVAKGTPSEYYLFQDSYSCLIKKEHFRSLTEKAGKKEINAIINQVANLRAEEGAGAYKEDDDKKQMVRDLTEYPECVGGTDKSQMQEVMADFMGAKVLGLYLKGKKLNQEERQAAVGFFVSDACQSGDNQKVPDLTKPSLAKSLNGIFQDYYASLDAHPISINRLQEIFLQDQNVRSAMGCSPSKNDCLNHDPSKVKKSSIGQGASGQNSTSGIAE